MKFRSNQQIDRLSQEKFFAKKLVESNQSELKTNLTQTNQNLIKENSNQSLNMKLSSNTLNSVCGLNNLGNTCFYNSVLQNLAQTPFLEELLSEYIKTNDSNSNFHIKHDNDYDSELTDYDEETDNLKLNQSNELSKTNLNVDRKEKTNQSHRSIRLKDITLNIRESPGLLTRHLHEIINKMTSTNSVQNPNALFSSVCKKVPSFKGFQQQDSHELLRNLLDAVKTEELKRRQAAILDIFKINKSTGIDDLTKKKIKRYGRLASHTLIDRLFGGHLLSTIKCEECKSCVQRVEPFLDLSLPIVDDQTVSRPILVINDKNSTNLKKSKFNLDSLKSDTTNNEDSYDPKAKKMSKHQLKKIKREAKKLKKKGRSNSTTNEDEIVEKQNEDLNEKKSDLTNEKEEEENENENENVESEKKLNELTDNIQEIRLENTEDLLIEKKENEQQKLDIEISKVKSEDEHDEDDEELDENENDLENQFKLEAMKSISELEEIEPCSLESCLAKFTSKEILNDKINCENCTKNFNKYPSKNPQKIYTTALKQYLICQLPAVLTIHLKRFQQHGMRLEKSNKYVKFPLILDMSGYTTKMCINKSDKILYSLYGLVEHSGKLNSGHYTAYVKPGYKDLSSSHFNHLNNQKDFLCNQRVCHLNKIYKEWTEKKRENNLNEHRNQLNNKIDLSVLNQDGDKWYYISDSHVSEVNVARVLKSQAYILFYERIQ